MPSKGKNRSQPIRVLYDYFQSVQHVNSSKVGEPAKDRFTHVKAVSGRSRIQDSNSDVVASGSSDPLAPGSLPSQIEAAATRMTNLTVNARQAGPLSVAEKYNVCETVTNRSNIVTMDSGNETTLRSTNSHNTHSITRSLRTGDITRKTIVTIHNQGPLYLGGGETIESEFMSSSDSSSEPAEAISSSNEISRISDSKIRRKDGRPSLEIPDTKHSSPSSWRSEDRGSASVSSSPCQHISPSSYVSTPKKQTSTKSQGSNVFKNLKEFKKEQLPRYKDGYIRDYMVSDFQTIINGAIPLWRAGPHKYLDAFEGIKLRCPQLWDVGFFDERGGFTSLFNIKYTAEENRETGFIIPDNFEQATFLNNELPSTQVSKRSHIVPRNGNQFKLVREESDPSASSWVFELTQHTTQASILVLPDGALSTYFEGVHRFFATEQGHDYISRQSIQWYLHSREKRGYTKKENGDLLLVTGCYLAKTWATATYSGKKKLEPPHRLELQFVAAEGDYQWNGAEDMHICTGFQEPTSKSEPDQCIAVEVFRIYCDNTVWKSQIDNSSSIFSPLQKGFLLFRSRS